MLINADSNGSIKGDNGASCTDDCLAKSFGNISSALNSAESFIKLRRTFVVYFDAILYPLNQANFLLATRLIHLLKGKTYSLQHCTAQSRCPRLANKRGRAPQVPSGYNRL